MTCVSYGLSFSAEAEVSHSNNADTDVVSVNTHEGE